MKVKSLLILFLLPITLFAQRHKFKTITPSSNTTKINVEDLKPLQPIQQRFLANERLFTTPSVFNQLTGLSLPKQLTAPKFNNKLHIVLSEEGLPIYIKGKAVETSTADKSMTAKAIAYFQAIQHLLPVKDADQAFKLVDTNTDNIGQTHLRYQQTYQDIEVYGGEVILHEKEGDIQLFNGHYFKTPDLTTITATINESQAIELAKEALSNKDTYQDLDNLLLQAIGGQQIQSKLVVYHTDKQQAVLAWHIQLTPNVGSKWVYFINAQTGAIIHKHDQVCKLHAHHAEHSQESSEHSETKTSVKKQTTLVDGPVQAQAIDLLGVQRTLNTYQVGSDYVLIDASREMFNATQSTIPNDPVGVIWTVDANNGSPDDSNFGINHVVSGNNRWSDPIAVSAHYNAAQAYEYFRNTFGRNSINGQGGNVVSIINVTESGQDMDNAFWNGAAMFYGNGNQAFGSPLAISLDVAGHEMTHGVVQATANLDYYGESGALNESFADVFGVMIDRDDWGLAEDAVNARYFPTGVMRDMANPNNGASFGSPNWQPMHVNEQYTGREDNGGVHINSGIPNHAFYQFAIKVGKEKAEQVFYRALVQYLTRSSDFQDFRLAILQSAEDLYTSTEVQAAAAALDFVGILGASTGGGGTTIDDDLTDLDINEGDELILLSNTNLSALYLANPQGQLVSNPLIETNLKSRPSLPDDGTFAIYVTDDNFLRAFDFGENQEFILSEEPVWRNVAISKDGFKLAAITEDFDNQLLIYDFNSQVWESYELYTPTTQTGITTGDVLYADVLEWSYDGESVMYDAINQIKGSTGEDIEYWDIGFVRVWDKENDTFGDGFIAKLFNSLGENISVGNPTFAKNSPYIIALDYLDDYTGEFFLAGANIETGDIAGIYQNSQLSVPSYSVDDSQIIFDASTGNTEVLAIVDIAANKIESANNPLVFIEGGKWGVWFGTGVRDLSTDIPEVLAENLGRIYPNPFATSTQLEWTGQIQDTQIQISDITGRILVAEVMTNATTQLPVEQLPVGTYFVKVITTDGYIIQKVVKQ